ncbi:MAG: hypothetical protein EA422_02095 [Gemmatimonadales bacterium]|nr:MAG: hypothetical protein EA422_02095 [Gemmatimonadales bacterium]
MTKPDPPGRPAVPDLSESAGILGQEDGSRPVLRLLEALGRGLGVDRVHVAEFVNHGRYLDGVYEWNAPGLRPAFPETRRLPLQAFPWWMDGLEEALETGRGLRISAPSDVPEDATAEHTLMEESGARAILALPLAGPSLGLVGFLAFVHTGRGRNWTDEEVRAVSPSAYLLARRLESGALLRQRDSLAEQVSRLEEVGGIGVWEFDPGSGYTFWSPVAHRILRLPGYLPDPTLFDFFKRVHLADRDRARRVILRILDDDQPFTLECRLIPADGSEDRVRYVEIRGEVVTRPSEGRRIAGTLRDLTLSRRLEEELTRSQRLETVGKLAGGIAHDFNNLLAVIQANGELLLATGGVRPDGEEDVEQILGAARSGAALTNKLLSFVGTRSRRGGPVEANWLIGGVERILGRLLPEHIQLVVETGRDVAMVAMDGEELEQVIMNLALNARDAMAESGGIMHIRSHRIHLGDPHVLSPGQSINAGEYAVITVEDQGHGMGPDVRSRIFEPFFTTRMKGEGRGLGLSTAFGVIQQAGGGIEVDSSPGRGSVFRVYLPVD